MPVTINGSNTPTAGGVTYGDGTTYANTAAGSAGQVLLSAGASAPAWTAQSALSVGSATTATTATSATSATTATNLAGGSNGTIPYQSASGTTQMLAVGTAGQLLQTNGAGAPTWASVSSGLTLVQTVTASGSTAVVDGFSSTYDNYKILIRDVFPAADGRNFELKFYIAGTLISANYQYAYVNVNSSSANSNIGATGNSTIRLANSMDQTTFNRSNNYEITIYGVNGSGFKSIVYNGTYHFSDTTYSINGAGTQTGTSGTLTGIQVAFPGSSFGGGTLQLYGFAKA